jgi:hypothetical protein
MIEQSVLRAFPVPVELREVTLGGNQWVGDRRERLQWRRSNNQQQQGISDDAGEELAYDEDDIILTPMQIRTFVVQRS